MRLRITNTLTWKNWHVQCQFVLPNQMHKFFIYTYCIYWVRVILVCAMLYLVVFFLHCTVEMHLTMIRLNIFISLNELGYSFKYSFESFIKSEFFSIHALRIYCSTDVGNDFDVFLRKKTVFDRENYQIHDSLVLRLLFWCDFW